MRKIKNYFLLLLLLFIPLVFYSSTANAETEISSKFKVQGNTYGIITGTRDLIVLSWNRTDTSADLNQTISYAGKNYKITEIGEDAFYNCNIETINIPDTITSIGSCAFYNCENLSTVVLPNSITRIEGSTFKFCDNLTELNIPDTIEYVSDTAFFHTSLGEACGDFYVIDNKIITSLSSEYDGKKDWIIPEGIIGIANNAFENYTFTETSVENVTLPSTLKFIGNNAFSKNSNLTNINLPNSLVSIGEYCFKDTNIASITIPDGVTEIKSSTFSRCENLTSVKLGKNTQHLRANAFYRCTSLENVTLPNSVTDIYSGAFSGCSSLQEIVIPKKVSYIGANAFSGCYSLYKFTFKGKCPKVSLNLYYRVDIFDNCENLTTIYVPKKYVKTYKKMFPDFYIKSTK